MLRRIVLKIIHSLAVRVFATLEVLGIPRIPRQTGEEAGAPPEGRDEG
jgi:hypothetical protein